MKLIRCLLLLITVLLLSGVVSAQKKVITGKITDKQTGEPLMGVSVIDTKNKVGTETSKEGLFTLSLETSSNSLLISSIGYSNQLVSLTGVSFITVAMVPASDAESEVVVIGYGTQKKSSITGAVSKYKNEKLDQAPVSRLDQALQGKIAGVQIQNISSEAGSDPRVQVRGVSSINAGQSPLVVVDGHPVPDGLAFVNMTDVESVEVLKDAASAAIYGSRGSSGVILITTKSGKSQKPKYSFKASWGSKDPYKLYPIMTTTEYAELLYSEAALRFADTGWSNYASAAQLTAKGNFASTAEKAAYVLEKNVLAGNSTDWQRAALRTGNVKNASLSVSGGTNDVKYYISGAYQNDQGMINHSEYERFSISSKLDANLSKKLKLSFNFSPSFFKRERPSTSFTDFTRVASYLPLVLDASTAAFISQNPTYANVQPGDFAQPRMFNDLNYNGTLPDGSTFTNALGNTLSLSTSANNSPYAILETQKITAQDYRLFTSSDISYQILPELTFKTMLSAYINYSTSLDFAKSNSSAAGAVSKGVYINRLYIDLLNENTLTYTKRFKDHSFNVVVGFTAQKVKLDSSKSTGLNFQSDNITSLNTALSIDQPNTYTNSNKIGLISYLTRINYGYKDKYLLSASFRADGSSYFGPGNKWGTFPAVSLGWVASKEKFMQNISWINNLKFRGSYGTTGNNRIIDFAFVNLLYAANYPFGPGTGTSTQGLNASASILSNPNITWERTFQFNGGVDIALFRNRISLSLDVYQSKTDKLLLNQAALGITGVPQTWNNIGRLQNNGIELELSSNNIREKNFTWTTALNFAHTQNKLLQLGNEAYLLNIGERQDGYINQVGRPLIEFYGFKTDGVWLSQSQINSALAKGAKSSLAGYFTPGALKFVDINGDGTIDLNDRTTIGNPYPDFTWGITNSFNYKSFDLSFTFQGVQGGKVLNGDAFYNEARKYNKTFNENRWISPANPGDGLTPYFTNGYTNAWTQSDYIIKDASYYALREVLIGYTMPARFASKIKLTSFRIYFSAQNLFFHANKDYTGLNIEGRNTSGAYSSPLLDGYQRGAFPTNRTLLIGVELKF